MHLKYLGRGHVAVIDRCKHAGKPLGLWGSQGSGSCSSILVTFMALTACIRRFSSKMSGNVRPWKTLSSELIKLGDLLCCPVETHKLWLGCGGNWGHGLTCSCSSLVSRLVKSDNDRRTRCCCYRPSRSNNLSSCVWAGGARMGGFSYGIYDHIRDARCRPGHETSRDKTGPRSRDVSWFSRRVPGRLETLQQWSRDVSGLLLSRDNTKVPGHFTLKCTKWDLQHNKFNFRIQMTKGYPSSSSAG